MSRWRGVVYGFLALSAAASLAACSSDFSREVKTYSISDDDQTLTVWVNSCGEAGLQVDALESEDTVRIRAQVDGVPRGGDTQSCATEVDLRLRSPLGDRTVVDFGTNEQLEFVP